jgi:hypothetical protein
MSDVVRKLYETVRRETAGIMGYSAADLTPVQTMRLDLATSLRFALDNGQSKIINGKSADVSELIAASETLAKLLPALADEPPPQQREDARLKLQRLIEGAVAARAYDVEHGICSECARLREQVSELQARIQFMKTPLRDPDQEPLPEQPAAASPTLPSELLPPASSSYLAPWHGGASTPSPWNSQSPQQQSPPSGPGRHYGPGSSSDFRDYVDPSGLIRSTPRSGFP